VRRLLGIVKSQTFINLVQTVVLVGTLLATWYLHQLDWQAEADQKSAELMIEFTDRLYAGPAASVTWALELQGNLDKANVRDQAIDDFLGKYELLDEACEHHLPTDEMADDAFAYDLTKAFADKKIIRFIQDSRRADPEDDIYGGVLDLARRHFDIDTAPFAARVRHIDRQGQKPSVLASATSRIKSHLTFSGASASLRVFTAGASGN